MQKSSRKSQRKITQIGITNNKISGRGGISFFLRYVEQIGFYKLSEKILGHIRITSKGLSLYQFIKQIIAYFIDGTLRTGIFSVLRNSRINLMFFFPVIINTLLVRNISAPPKIFACSRIRLAPIFIISLMSNNAITGGKIKTIKLARQQEMIHPADLCRRIVKASGYARTQNRFNFDRRITRMNISGMDRYCRYRIGILSGIH
jgi:hypothetical protein